MFARRDINFCAPVEIRLENADGTKLYSNIKITVDSAEWKKYKADMVCDTEDFSGRLVILIHDAGSVCLDMVSLFPDHTFHGRENGLRPDIAQFLADIKPRFVRFPGGCLTHAGAVDDKARDAMYRWKNTIGPLEARPSKRNNWRYNQTYGFSYYEFFCFCEDIGAKPMPVLPGAFNPHEMYYTPMEEMQPWIDDVLELLEFANGPVDSKWGAVRAQLGHAKPFGVEYIAIGNEEMDKGFFERYPLFHNAIAEKYPDVKILNTAGPSPSGRGFDLGWESAKKWNSYAVDEHYYVSPNWLIQHYNRYFSDFYDPNGPKVFLGEYASRNDTFYNALCEAAYMTGFERNADRVALTCYAPLLCNSDYVNWKPNLIWYNNHEVYGIPSYYVQKMYANNQGDVTLPVSCEITAADACTEPAHIRGGFAFGAMPGNASFSNIMLNGTPVEKDVITVNDTHWNYVNGAWKRTPDEKAETGIPRFFRMGFPLDFELPGDWEDFTLSCTAAASEREQERTAQRGSQFPRRRGVQISFACGEELRLSWSLGGYRGTESILMAHYNTMGDDSIDVQPFVFQDGELYALELIRKADHIICKVNGEVIHDTVFLHDEPQRIYVSSTLDEAAKEVIIKAVNVRNTPVKIEIAVQNAGQGARMVQLEQLCSNDPEARNSFEQPQHVATQYSEFAVDDVPFLFEFPACSVNIFRVPIL